jgi:hypothetical protein
MRGNRLIAGSLAGLAVALHLGAPAGAADVHIGINIGTPPVVVAAPPALVVVPGTSVYYAPAVPQNFFYFDGRYYTYHEGGWFSATTHAGPWVFLPAPQVPRPVLAVPVTYYKVPPGHWKKGGPPPWAGHGAKHKKYKGD